MIYFVNRHGFVPNSNRTWGLVRSQPPFLSLMVRDIYNVTGDKEGLSECYNAIKTEYKFWQNERNTPCVLNRYFGHYEDYAFLCERFCTRLKIEKPTSDHMRREYADAFHSGCESGWDFSSISQSLSLSTVLPVRKIGTIFFSFSGTIRTSGRRSR
jgi:alpha,alpha-trehalase